MFLELLLTAIITYPASDCSYLIRVGESPFHVISEATIGSNFNLFLEIIITFIVIGIIVYTTNIVINIYVYLL